MHVYAYNVIIIILFHVNIIIYCIAIYIYNYSELYIAKYNYVAVPLRIEINNFNIIKVSLKQHTFAIIGIQ